MEREELYKELIAKYGILQLAVAVEELSELQKEICKSLRDKTNIDNIVEEIADVTIMLEQLKIYFKISDNDLNSAIDYKIKRTKERLT
jgi:hypothetical protein